LQERVEVGFQFGQVIVLRTQDITLIDCNKDSLSIYADSHLDIRVLRGDATSIAILKDAQVDKSDLVIGSTSSETNKINLCMLAKTIGSKRTIARHMPCPEFILIKRKLILPDFRH